MSHHRSGGAAKTNARERLLSLCAFSLLSAFILSFLFEGQVLYGVLDSCRTDPASFVVTPIIAHLIGLITCGFFCKNPRCAKRVMLCCTGICLLLTIPFFFSVSILWMPALAISGYASGCAVAVWGCFLKMGSPSSERIKTCADVLILSNVLMVVIDVVAVHVSITLGLILSLSCLPISMFCTWLLPTGGATSWSQDGGTLQHRDTESSQRMPSDNLMAAPPDIRKPLGILFLFVAIITIDSGLMYQVINPGFSHLSWLTSWYWALPYIVAIAIMRNLPVHAERSLFLYVGMGMIVSAFIAFMLLGRSAADYLIVDTLMLGACGIFDLFWWSTIGKTLDYAINPIKLFGIGLSANVFGVLCGDAIGMAVTAAGLPEAQVTVIALTVACVTLGIIPPLNHQLASLWENRAELSGSTDRAGDTDQPSVTAPSGYVDMRDGTDQPSGTSQTGNTVPFETGQAQASASVQPFSPLTMRESAILELILEGRSNKEIAAGRFVTQNTVKTHLKSIYAKYGVSSRAELISLLLRNRVR